MKSMAGGGGKGIVWRLKFIVVLGRERERGREGGVRAWIGALQWGRNLLGIKSIISSSIPFRVTEMN